MFKVNVGIVALMVGMGIARSAGAQEVNTDKDYCDKVQARAHADAWLLFAPSIQLQAIRYPAAGNITVVGGSTDLNGDQVRGNLSWSPLDALRGTHVLTIADKDCLQHAATQEANNLLEQMGDVGRSAALQAEVSYLKMHSDEMNDILTSMQKRLGIGNITITDVATIQQSIDAINRKLAVSQGQLDVIHAKDYVSTVQSAGEIATKLQQYSMEFENETSKLRMFDPWTVQTSFGVVPPMASVDKTSWYGSVSIGYNFGGLPRGGYENRYLNARQHELAHARYELTDAIRRVKDGVVAGISSSDAEIATLNDRITNLLNTKAHLASHPDAPNAISVLSMVSLQIIDAVSDQLYLIELRRQLTEWK